MKNIAIILITLLSSLSIYAQTTATQNNEKHYTKYLTTAAFKENIFDYTTGGQWAYKGTKPCLIDFYATWCGPCKALAPRLEELAKEYDGQIVIYKVDTDKEKELAAVFGVRSIPTLLFVPADKMPQVAQGAMPKEQLAQLIDVILLGKTPIPQPMPTPQQ